MTEKTLILALEESASHHSHLCPRQVLGVRLGLYGLRLLALEAGRKDKQLLVIAETDGCFVDGLSAASKVSVGHRTLRIEDYGKIAATFIDTISEHMIRLAPRTGIRQRAMEYAPGEMRHYSAQLFGYQAMPDEDLFTIQEVQLTTPLQAIMSRPCERKNCSLCQEEIINQREVVLMDQIFCRACAGQVYYQMAQGRLLDDRLSHQAWPVERVRR